jgi:hypothetical protein
MIKNLITSLPEMGKIKAGTKGEEVMSKQGKKFRLPKKLNHFIITTTERDDADNFILDTDLMEVLKESPESIIDKDENIVGLPIRLLYNDIDLNFATQYACYVGGKCVCSGDGEVGNTRDGRTIKCPCDKLEYVYEGKDKCKANGKLLCIIDGATMMGACHVLRTTSINTVKSILGGLSFIQTAASGMLAFLPLHLILKPRTVTTPSGAPTTVYISSIVFRGSISDLRQKALGMAKEKAQYLIEMDGIEETARKLINVSVESEQEQADVQAEFYPDSVGIEAEIVEKPAAVITEKVKNEIVQPTAVEALSVAKTPDGLKPEEKPTKKMITKDQKMQIVKLKKENNITNPADWMEKLKPFDVKTANHLTFDQANLFIESLRSKDDIPF